MSMLTTHRPVQCSYVGGWDVSVGGGTYRERVGRTGQGDNVGGTDRVGGWHGAGEWRVSVGGGMKRVGGTYHGRVRRGGGGGWWAVGGGECGGGGGGGGGEVRGGGGMTDATGGA